jgi:hypothetical protein
MSYDYTLTIQIDYTSPEKLTVGDQDRVMDEVARRLNSTHLDIQCDGFKAEAIDVNVESLSGVL